MPKRPGPRPPRTGWPAMSACSATLTVSCRSWCPTISRPGSPMPASTPRSSTAHITSWRAITAPALFRPGAGGHGTRPVRKKAFRLSRPGCWQPCAIACSSHWMSGDPGAGRRGQRAAADRTLTRRMLFEEQEKPLLKPLPAEPFVIGRWSRYKLAPDYHVSVEGVAYSVPYRLIGKHVDVFCTVSLVSIFHKGQRVAAHARQDAEPGRATVTLDEHRPPNHRAAVLLTPETIRAEAAGLGGALGLLADRIFADADHPDQAARQVAGLLRLGQLHGTEALQAAATVALSANVRSYRFVQHLLGQGPDRGPGGGRRRRRSSCQP